MSPSLRLLMALNSALRLGAATHTTTATTAALMAYRSFRRQFHPSTADANHSNEDFAVRLHLFQDRKAEVEAHNSMSGATWKASLNRFADFTEDERRALLGYKRIGGRSTGVTSLLQMQARVRNRKLRGSEWMYEEDDDEDVERVQDGSRWQRLNSSSFHREQGSCGSCWAVAAAGAIEMHAEIKQGKVQRTSFNQLVDCVPNPDHCGGTGGCDGATAELAFAYIKTHGLALESDYSSSRPGSRCAEPAQLSISTRGFVRLPENELKPLLHAVGQLGPVVVSVDASRWFSYQSGVFNGCPMDSTINHAVLVTGYGHDTTLGMSYWLLRNSWGQSWGEGGFMRIERHNSDQGKAGYCGIDNDPQQGVGCEGGPKQIPVCGMCGILSDTSYPLGVVMS